MRTALFSILTLALAAQEPAPKAETPKPAAPQAQPAPAPAVKAEAPKDVTAPKAEAAAKPAAPQAKPAPKKPEKPKEDKVLARIGETLIRESDFEAFLGSMNPQQRMQMEIMGMKPELQRQFLQYSIIAAKARKEGMDKSPEFKKRMKLMEMQVLLQGTFEGPVGQALQAKIKLGDADVKAYYDKHADKFKSPESFSARHILVSLKGSPSAGDKGLTEEEAKAKIAKIQEELKAGKSWDEVAKANSDDPGSKDKGGLYENYPFGSFVPEFEQAVRTQELGKPGEPVKTKFGYHLIQVEKRNPVTIKPFDTVKEEAKQMATQARSEEVLTEYANGLKKELSYSEGPAATEAAKPAAKPSKKPAKKTTQGATK